jgi:serum/glucocorticoid-regulated kinase 2
VVCNSEFLIFWFFKLKLKTFLFHKESAIDTSNFDEEFTSETPKDSYVTEHIEDIDQEIFVGFTYNPTHEGIMSGSMANSIQDL